MCSNSGSRSALAPVGLGLAVLLLVSCEFPFSLRQTAEPTGSSTQLVPTTQPLDVRKNIFRCINNRDAISYGTQLADDFTFVADPIDVAQLEQTYPGAFQDWTVDVERRVVEYLLDDARCSLSILGFADSTILEETDNTYSIQYDYSFALILDGDVHTYSGAARLFMRKQSEDNLWRLYKWEDIRLEGTADDTWGIIKGTTRATM
jgi:hypothetical protein